MLALYPYAPGEQSSSHGFFFFTKISHRGFVRFVRNIYQGSVTVFHNIMRFVCHKKQKLLGSNKSTASLMLYAYSSKMTV